MRVIVLGKRRYRSRQDIASLLALGRDLGHSVELLDRDQFLEARLDDVDVVLAKSHYKDASIKNRLRAVEARVITTSPPPTDVCPVPV